MEIHSCVNTNPDCGRFKLIPSIVSGPFIVRKAVGNKPALLGRKVTQRYFRGPGYVETDIGEPCRSMYVSKEGSFARSRVLYLSKLFLGHTAHTGVCFGRTAVFNFNCPARTQVTLALPAPSFPEPPLLCSSFYVCRVTKTRCWVGVSRRGELDNRGEDCVAVQGLRAQPHR